MTLRARLAGLSGATVVLVLGLGVGCIIPDADIRADGEFDNPGAIRIVEPTPISPRADEDCDELTILGGCPRVPDTAPSGLIRPESPLCVCPSLSDIGLGDFDIFVEDPDVDEQGNARDDLFGALFLDVPNSADDITPYLAFTNLLAPDEPAMRFAGDELETIERPTPQLKAWQLSSADRARVDLCNNNDGAQLLPGIHELSVIVTDRPWFQPVITDEDGMTVLDDEDEPVLGEIMFGLPDLAAGATYDTTSYVFQCFDASNPPEGIECNCEP